MKPAIACCLLAGSLTQVGCYDWVEIRPTELPRVTEASVQIVEDSDGQPVQVRGGCDVRVTNSGGATTYSAPVRSRLAQGSLVVEGPGRLPQSYPLQEPTRVELSQLDAGDTRVALVVGVLAALSVGAFVAYARSPGP